MDLGFTVLNRMAAVVVPCSIVWWICWRWLLRKLRPWLRKSFMKILRPFSFTAPLVNSGS